MHCGIDFDCGHLFALRLSLDTGYSDAEEIEICL